MSVKFTEWLKVKCNVCGYEWVANKHKKGHWIIWAICYLLYVIPWIIYSIWRRNDCVCECPRCKSTEMELIKKRWRKKSN